MSPLGNAEKQWSIGLMNTPSWPRRCRTSCRCRRAPGWSCRIRRTSRLLNLWLLPRPGARPL